MFGELTKAAVDQFYAAAGYQPVPASPTSTADLAAALDAGEAADAALAAAQLTFDAASAGVPPSEVAAAEAAGKRCRSYAGSSHGHA